MPAEHIKLCRNLRSCVCLSQYVKWSSKNRITEDTKLTHFLFQWQSVDLVAPPWHLSSGEASPHHDDP